MAPPYVDPEQPLVAAAKAGDEAAAAELWRALQPALLRYLRGRIGSGAEDVASAVWLDAARGLPRFEGDDGDFRRWLFTIARRRLIDELRRRGRTREDSTAWVPQRPDPAEQPDREQLGAALALVRLLPADQADAVLLRVVADMDVSQVAAVMGKREGTVRVLVHRGLRRLQALLEERRVTQDDPTAMYGEQ
jgi:RNA polymerase sigma-70 factor (ECF subfamily)